MLTIVSRKGFAQRCNTPLENTARSGRIEMTNTFWPAVLHPKVTIG